MEAAEDPLILSVECKTTEADLAAYFRHQQWKTSEGEFQIVMGMLGAAVFGAALGMVASGRYHAIVAIVTGIMVAPFYPLVIWLNLHYLAKIFSHQSKSQLPATLVVTPEALFLRQGSVEGRRDWSSFREITETVEHLFLVVAPLQGIVIPRRAFGSPAAAEKYLVVAREYWQAAKDHTEAPLPMEEIEAALGPQRLGIEFQLTRRDYQHLQWYHLRRHKISALALVAMVLVGSGLVGWIRHSVYLAVITALFVVAAVGALTWTQWQALQQNPGLFRRHSLFISPAGLWLRTPGQGDGLMEWSAIVEVVADAKYLMLFYGPNLALLVSRRAFPSAEEADRFLQRACEWQAAHAAPKPG